MHRWIGEHDVADSFSMPAVHSRDSRSEIVVPRVEVKDSESRPTARMSSYFVSAQKFPSSCQYTGASAEFTRRQEMDRWKRTLDR